MPNKVLLGSHISLKSPEYFLGSVNEALSYNENCFMFYTGAPQNSIRVSLDKLKINEGLLKLHENNLDPTNLIIHAPYIINLANPDVNKQQFSLNVLKNEMIRAEAFKVKYLVLHPGSHLGFGKEIGIKNLIEGLNHALKDIDNDIVICIETMAGKSNEIGKNFEEIKEIINGINLKRRIGVCIDTCHINDAGYNLNDFNSVIKEFNDVIGLNYLKVIHLNDSKNIINSHKDRHENIGYGTIGFTNLLNWVFDERLKDIPKILETPYFNGKPFYKEEIEIIRKREFTDFRH